MEDIKVIIDSMSSMIKKVGDSVDDLDQLLKSMYESVTGLNKTWEGPNHTEFIETFENHYEDMEKMNKSMKAYHKSLKEAEKLYEKCLDEIDSIV